MKKQPIKDEKKSYRMERGGTWYYDEVYGRISHRSNTDPRNVNDIRSFRIVRSKDRKQ